MIDLVNKDEMFRACRMPGREDECIQVVWTGFIWFWIGTSGGLM
jgi:hypothetical protein